MWRVCAGFAILGGGMLRQLCLACAGFEQDARAAIPIAEDQRITIDQRALGGPGSVEMALERLFDSKRTDRFALVFVGIEQSSASRASREQPAPKGPSSDTA